MAKFNGKIGFSETVETIPGSFEYSTIERYYQGSLLKNYTKYNLQEQSIHNITLSNKITIVGDNYAFNHYFAIKYVIMDGAKWVVDSVELARPRLILTIGGLYNG